MAGACPSCGSPISATDRFCEACGHELAPGATPADAGAAAAAAAVAAQPPAPANAPPCPACGATVGPVDGYCSECGAKAPAERDHQELSFPGVAAVTDKGKRHHRNEDAMAVAVEPGTVFAVVCDGVSTTVHPDLASLAAVTAALDALVHGGSDTPALDPAYDAGRAAALAVEFEPAADLGPPSCTFLAAVITDGRAEFASLGDCRAYWLGDDGARQLTRDDSWATEQIDAGLLAADDAYADAKAHMITRWIGRDADPSWRPVRTTFEPPGAGRLVLCSDGLWNYTLTPAELEQAAGREPDTFALARSLTAFANDAGGADNITVVVVDIPLPKGD